MKLKCEELGRGRGEVRKAGAKYWSETLTGIALLLYSDFLHCSLFFLVSFFFFLIYKGCNSGRN